MNIIDDTVIDLTSSMMLACLQLFICIHVCFANAGMMVWSGVRSSVPLPGSPPTLQSQEPKTRTGYPRDVD